MTDTLAALREEWERPMPKDQAKLLYWLGDFVERLFARAEAAEREIEELREALEPFTRGNVVKYGARSRGLAYEYSDYVERARKLLAPPASPRRGPA